MVAGLAELIDGLSTEEAEQVATDLAQFGQAFVETVDGKKRRIAPQDVYINSEELPPLRP